MNRYALLLTLGHNASAIVVHKETGIPVGYEEERLTRVKSDSRFPVNAIKEIGKHVPLNQVDTFYVSCWFNGFSLHTVNKYWDYALLRDLCPNAVYCDADLTHHDMHAMSAVAFTEQYIKLGHHRWHILVIDGFGTNEEVVSLYEKQANEQAVPHLVYRVSGYERSLGLMFQYAAEYQGMDGINDVYKYLGYRVRIDESRIGYVRQCADRFMRQMKPHRGDSEEAVYPINKARLTTIKSERFMRFYESCQFSREEMGYFLQTVLEREVLSLLKRFGVTNLMAAGGCFLNVRLNGMMLKHLDRMSIMPLAGDQGAAIGAYRFCMGPRSFKFGDLAWGVRPPRPASISPTTREPHEGLYLCRPDEFPDRIDEITDRLNKGEIVNIVRGNMEFGSRALCFTSTLAPPTPQHVEAINTLNGRSTVMPMAPVMTYGEAHRLFDRHAISRVLGTDQFMVCAHTFARGKGDEVRGAALLDGEDYTGRPQIIHEEFSPELYQLLTQVDYPCLINTSLNSHGEPIIFTYEQTYDLHALWLSKRTSDMPAFSTYCFL